MCGFETCGRDGEGMTVTGNFGYLPNASSLRLIAQVTSAKERDPTSTYLSYRPKKVSMSTANLPYFHLPGSHRRLASK